MWTKSTALVWSPGIILLEGSVRVWEMHNLISLAIGQTWVVNHGLTIHGVDLSSVNNVHTMGTHDMCCNFQFPVALTLSWPGFMDSSVFWVVTGAHWRPRGHWVHLLSTLSLMRMLGTGGCWQSMRTVRQSPLEKSLYSVSYEKFKLK